MGTKQLNQMWDGIVDLANSRIESAGYTHFIGSVVLIPSTDQVAGTVNRFLVGDGQQRLTTLPILLAGIRSSLSGLDQAPIAPEMIDDLYLINKYKAGADRLMRLPSSSGHPICTDLVSVGEDVHGEFVKEEIHPLSICRRLPDSSLSPGDQLRMWLRRSV